MDDRKILELQPLPIARSYRRYRKASQVRERERHDAASQLFEVYLRYAASLAVAHYLASGERDRELDAVFLGLARPGISEWLRFLADTLKLIGRREGFPAAVKDMRERLERKDQRDGDLPRLHHALRSLRSGAPQNGEGVSLLGLLGELVAYRRLPSSEGAQQKSGHYHRFADLMARAYHELIRRSPFLAAFKLISVDVLPAEAGAPGITEFMGLEPARKEAPRALLAGMEDPREGRLYFLGHDGRALSAHPFLVAHKDDVYFLACSDGDPHYVSGSTGDRHRPEDLKETLDELSRELAGGAREGLAGSKGPGQTEGDGSRLGDYRVERQVGRPETGPVYLAVDDGLGREVALKVLAEPLAGDPRRLARFQEEVRVLARIRKPGLPAIHRVGAVEGSHYCAMEWIEGLPLDRVASASAGAGGPDADLPARVQAAVEGIASVAEALGEAHRGGVVHGAVKPSSILVQPGGRHVLVDFRPGQPAGALSPLSARERKDELACLPPERIAGQPVDQRSDVYGLGTALYRAVTLRPPFEAPAEHPLAEAVLSREPMAPRTRNPRLHPDLEAVIQKAMEKQPERRYPSAAELAEDLRRFLRHEPIQAQPRPRGKLQGLFRKAR